MTIMPVYRTTFTPIKTPIKFFMAGLTFLIAHISHADDGRTDNQEPINQEIATLEPIINHAQPELLSHDALTPKIEPILAQTPNPAEDTLIADEALLLDNPDLLNHALNSAVMTNHMAGVHALLPIYQKLPKDHQNGILLGYANALATLDKAAGCWAVQTSVKTTRFMDMASRHESGQRRQHQSNPQKHHARSMDF